MKTERNAALKWEYETGVPVPELLATYSISRSRLYQLVNPTAHEGQRARRKEKLDAK
jgi:Mor family transcriptional regulator